MISEQVDGPAGADKTLSTGKLPQVPLSLSHEMARALNLCPHSKYQSEQRKMADVCRQKVSSLGGRAWIFLFLEVDSNHDSTKEERRWQETNSI